MAARRRYKIKSEQRRIIPFAIISAEVLTTSMALLIGRFWNIYIVSIFQYDRSGDDLSEEQKLLTLLYSFIGTLSAFVVQGLIASEFGKRAQTKKTP